MTVFRQTNLTGASNAGAVAKNCNSPTSISLHRVLSTLRPPGVINTHGAAGPLQIVTFIAAAGCGGICWWQETTTECLCQEVSTLRQRRQNRIAFNCTQW